MEASALSGLVVVERGGRLAAAVAATLLGGLGATVVRVEDAAGRPASDPPSWHSHPLALEGKLRVTDTALPSLWSSLCAQADVAFVSDPALLTASCNAPLKVLVTAFGCDAKDASASELAVQARSGSMATTGPSGGAPCTVRAPLLEMMAGLNAATSTLAALRAGTRGVLDLALLDGALALCGTFHSQALADPDVRFRHGARHPLCAPWNAYRAADGWVTICIASDDQWIRLARRIGRDDLADRADLATSPQRVAAAREVDVAVAQWTQARTVQDIVRALHDVDLPASSVHRSGPDAASGVRVVQSDAEPGRTWTVPAHLAWLSRTPLRASDRIGSVVPDAAPDLPPRSPRQPRDGTVAPLAGLRVVELGPFTAGPLTGRYLAELGAEVVKVEPPGGERSRAWQPRAAHASHYFANYNCGKRSVEIDLSTPSGADALRALLRDADVFVQNLKPGALRKMGIDVDDLVATHPRLIVCSISGYGRSGSPAAALDTIVQAGSGLMALVDGPDTAGPLKTGFSYGDLTAAHLAALLVLAAILERDRSGRGQAIDIAMHDALVWLTQLGWPEVGTPATRVSASDGGWSLCVESSAPEPVLEAGAALRSEDAHRREILRTVDAGNGDAWHVLASPHRWRQAPASTGTFVATAGADNARLLSPDTV